MSVQLLELRLRRAIVNDGVVLPLLSTLLYLLSNRIFTLFNDLLVMLLIILHNTLSSTSSYFSIGKRGLAAIWC